MSAARLKVGLFAAALSCSMVGYVWAQQQQQEQQQEQREQQDQQRPLEAARERGTEKAREDIRSARPGQAGRARTGQSDRATQQEGQQTRQFASELRGGQSQQPVEQFLAHKLLSMNKAEVQLGQFAQQHAQNPKVKEFAQQMIEDHQPLVQQLQEIVQGQGGQSERERGQGLGATTQLEAQRQAGDTTRLPGTPGAGQPDPTGLGQPGTQVDLNANQDATQRRTAGQDQQQGQSRQAVQRLIQISEQIHQRHLEMVREELQQRQGAEFDQAFVGEQLAAHMEMLAALEVIAQQGPQRLQQIAQQAQPVVQEHLDHARQLKEQLSKDGQRSGAQAERQQPDQPKQR